MMLAWLSRCGVEFARDKVLKKLRPQGMRRLHVNTVPAYCWECIEKEENMAMHADITLQNGKGVVSIDGSLTAASVDAFRELMQKWMAEHEAARQIVLDAEAMDYIDSAGLGVLIALLKQTTERGGDIRIARLGKKARMVFDITRAFMIFEIFDTVEEALGAEA